MYTLRVAAHTMNGSGDESRKHKGLVEHGELSNTVQRSDEGVRSRENRELVRILLAGSILYVVQLRSGCVHPPRDIAIWSYLQLQEESRPANERRKLCELRLLVVRCVRPFLRRSEKGNSAARLRKAQKRVRRATVTSDSHAI
jgi:hypothetical protein